MGLFGGKKKCCICGSDGGSKKIIDGFVCNDCAQKTGIFNFGIYWKQVNADKVKEAISSQKEYEKLSKIFAPTQKVDKCFQVDEKNNLWTCNGGPAIFHYGDIVNYELIENGAKLTQAAIGGGMKTKVDVRELRVKIVVKHPVLSEVYVNLLPVTNVKSGSLLHREYMGNAQKVMSILDVITSNKQEQKQPLVADEILKYKNLLDMGVITPEEFEAKKRQLLEL